MASLVGPSVGLAAFHFHDIILEVKNPHGMVVRLSIASGMFDRDLNGIWNTFRNPRSGCFSPEDKVVGYS